MSEQIQSSIIVLTYNNLFSCTIPCIESIVKYTNLNKNELIIIDNFSTDETRDWLKTIQKQSVSKNIKVILNDENLGYASGNNVGIRLAKGQNVVLLNNDTLVSDGWLEQIVAPLANSKVGLVGPITNRIGSMQQITIPGLTEANYERLSLSYTKKHKNDYFNVKKLCFFCVAINRKLIEAIGLLDENFGRGNFEDDDYCLSTLRAGYKILIAEGVFVFHKGSYSFNQVCKSEYAKLIEKNLRYFESKHSVSYSYENLLLDYKEIHDKADEHETYLYRKPIFDLINGLIRPKIVPSYARQVIKEIDRRFFFGSIRWLYTRFSSLKELPIKLRSYIKFYQTYDIEGCWYRLKEMLRISEKKQNQIQIPDELPRDTPIFVLSYNRLTCLKKLIDYLCECGYSENIVIIDNASTYPPLLNYLTNTKLKVVRLPKNYGHLALWKSRCFEDIITRIPFVLTDCDIIPDEHCPKDFLQYFYQVLRSDSSVTKVGFALSISDIPAEYNRKDEVVLWEMQHWLNPCKNKDFYRTPIDTTFALYRPNIKPYMKKWWASLRSNYPYIARHYPWYITCKSEPEVIAEERYYKKNIKDVSSHWYTTNYLTNRQNK